MSSPTNDAADTTTPSIQPHNIIHILYHCTIIEVGTKLITGNTGDIEIIHPSTIYQTPYTINLLATIKAKRHSQDYLLRTRKL